MSHDLSNIHQAVYGIFDILLIDNDLKEHTTETLQEGLNQMKRCTRLIHNVQKFKKIEDSPPKRVPIDLFDSLSKAENLVQNSVPYQKLNLRMTSDCETCYVLANEYLVDVFYELLHNALKFDRKSQVDVEIDVSKSEEDSMYRFTISDFGSGISNETKEYLFGRISLKRKGYLGTGIGLTLLSHIINHYEGKIQVQDRVPGDYTKGTKFIIDIPKAP
jgi:signal transduction histidine kinase